MTQQKLSPDFQERFAQISINLGADAAPESQRGIESDRNKDEGARTSGGPISVRKKAYPSHLYPGGTPNANYTTPSKQPVLSTAKRAKSRNLSSQLRNASSSTPGSQSLTTPSRMGFQGTTRNEQKSLSTVKPSKRILSCPMSERPQRTRNDHQFSFMKETSSSMNKHVSMFNNGVGTSPTPNRLSQDPQIIQKRISSSGTTKRRHQSEHRNRHTSGGAHANGGRDRRILSTQAPSIKPSDITNISYNVPTLKFQEIKSKDKYLKIPTYKGLSYDNGFTLMNSPSKSRHVSQPCTQVSQGDDVYNRLYNNSNNTRIRAGCISPISPLANNESRTKSPESFQSYSESTRVCNLEELFLLLYDEDRNLFSFGGLCHGRFTTKQAADTQKLASGAETPTGALGIYERGELLRKKDIYFMPSGNGDLKNDTRSINVRNYGENFGFDDKSGNYIIIPNDHINYRYEIESILGNGSFGNVVRCKDHKYADEKNNNKVVAIKIIKNDINWSLQAVYETKMLKHLSEKMKSNEKTIDVPLLKYIDHFHFRGHMCIVTEMLSLNLYSLLEIIKFRGLSLGIIKYFSKHILRGLDFIHKQNIIHCDIKPENIMIELPSNFDLTNPLVGENDFVVKIIDFGSSCFEKEISYSYIQSRFYRAPEVILGANYNNKIDIWSFGCVIAELFSGLPLLPGKNELEQIGLILEIFGAPNSSIIIDDRNKLMQSAKMQTAANNFDSIIHGDKITDLPMVNKLPIDEKAIKKTLLYRLFDLEGRINLQFLNMRCQADANATASTSASSMPVKKKYKLNSKSLDVLLRLNTSGENKKDSQLFTKFLRSVFKWNSLERPTAEELLVDPFLKNI